MKVCMTIRYVVWCVVFSVKNSSGAWWSRVFFIQFLNWFAGFLFVSFIWYLLSLMYIVPSTTSYLIIIGHFWKMIKKWTKIEKKFSDVGFLKMSKTKLAKLHFRVRIRFRFTEYITKWSEECNYQKVFPKSSTALELHIVAKTFFFTFRRTLSKIFHTLKRFSFYVLYMSLGDIVSFGSEHI